MTGLPGEVASGIVLSRDGRRVIMSVEGPHRPRELWCLSTRTLQWVRVTGVPRLPERELVGPGADHADRQRRPGADRLALSGAGQDGRPGPAMLSLHGGPEAQERPTFSPQHQAMVAAGITVFAPEHPRLVRLRSGVRARRRRARSQGRLRRRGLRAPSIWSGSGSPTRRGSRSPAARTGAI